MKSYSGKNIIQSGAAENGRDEAWTTVIRATHPWFDISISDLWKYRDLITLFVRRDFIAQYKQTILGPLWFFLQPLFTTIVFTIVFGRIAKISTDGMPQFLFYMAGTVCWGYFATCMTETSNTFITNAAILGKVYFPRLAIPISIVISNIFKFMIQFGLFLMFLGYFFIRGAAIHTNLWAFFLPVFVLQMAILGIGCGIIVSSLTTKYRDLTYLVNFGVQLWMYATPVVYPLSQIPERFRALISLNPMVAVVESFRQAFLGTSSLNIEYVIISWTVTLILLFVGLVLFSRVEKTFMDTI